ncbi:MAG: LytTR family transcriptional regulator DNA-binding domain-containing protein [Acetatifactor sp.]|nr:LytTR family transcriptional regulator DNA-binding domain-containing protein [Acetatifactor sp.]
MNELQKQLPSGIFSRSPQSYLVNMTHISRITRYELVSTGQTLPISQSGYMELQNSLYPVCRAHSKNPNIDFYIRIFRYPLYLFF